MLLKSKFAVQFYEPHEPNGRGHYHNENKTCFLLKKKIIGKTHSIYTVLTEQGTIGCIEFSSDYYFFEYFERLK